MRAQCQLSTAIAYGLNAFQAFVQRQTFFVDSQVYFAFFQVYRNCIVCSCINSDTVTCGIFSINSIDSVFQSFVCFLFIQFYIFTGNQCSMFTCFCFDIVQLAYVYCVGFSFTCFYIGNLLVICIHTTAGDICLVAITNASIRHIELSCFYAVYIQVFLQCQACCCNLKIIFACLEIYCNCIVFSANSNAIAFCIGGVFCIYSVDILSISSCSFIYRNDIGTCFYLCLSCCTYLIQLAYVYCVVVKTTGSYTANAAILSYFYFTIDFGTTTNKFYRCVTVS